MTSNMFFVDEKNEENAKHYLKVFLDITNASPDDVTTPAHEAWQFYVEAMQEGTHPCFHLYRFQGTEKYETVLLKSMYNSLLIYGPLSPDSDYVVCRCGRVVLKKDHYELHNPNADCCKFCVHAYDNENQFNADKLFEFPTSLQTSEAFDPSEPLQSPEVPVTIDWSQPTTEEPVKQVESCYGPILKPKRAYNARRKCTQCSQPNKNRKKPLCDSCLALPK